MRGSRPPGLLPVPLRVSWVRFCFADIWCCQLAICLSGLVEQNPDEKSNRNGFAARAASLCWFVPGLTVFYCGSRWLRKGMKVRVGSSEVWFDVCLSPGGAAGPAVVREHGLLQQTGERLCGEMCSEEQPRLPAAGWVSAALPARPPLGTVPLAARGALVPRRVC